METASFSAMSVNIYQSTRRNISEHFSFLYRQCENLRPYRYTRAGLLMTGRGILKEFGEIL